MKLAAICVAPTELGGLGDGFTINMSRLAALPRFRAPAFQIKWAILIRSTVVSSRAANVR
jgi:hypothetical protein